MRSFKLDSPQRQRKRVIFGLGVIGIGVLALLDNLHVFGWPLLRTLWPLVFVLWGLGRMLWPRHPGSWLFGLVLIAVGALMTLQNLDAVQLNLHDWWPVIVILAGLSILLRGAYPRYRRGLASRFEHSSIEHGDLVNIEASFGGVKQQNDSRSFKGGKIDAAFGGVELDLRRAAIEGGEATLELSATFSVISLKVPRDWLVVVNVSPTLAAVDDKTVPPANPTQRLVLRGETTFGGVEIKN